MKLSAKILLPVIFLLIGSGTASAQLPVSLELPRVSPMETRSITIGYTTIGFQYSSVGIKGREIWGALIPYGEVWRTGANENTVFTVTDDVLINGESLPAGSYGLHTIPGEESWTLIFSDFSEAWGSYFYDPSEDRLRVEVIPEKMNSTYEWMKFSFENYTDTTVDMSLKWAGLKVPFTVTVPVATTFSHIENQFRTLPAFGWQGWYQGAQYTLNNEYRMETGLIWADNALNRERSPQTLTMKARLLAKTGNNEPAMKTVDEMLSEFQDEWRAYTGAATVYKDLGDTKSAIEYYTQAAEMTPDRIAAQIRAEIEELKEM